MTASFPTNLSSAHRVRQKQYSLSLCVLQIHLILAAPFVFCDKEKFSHRTAELTACLNVSDHVSSAWMETWHHGWFRLKTSWYNNETSVQMLDFNVWQKRFYLIASHCKVDYVWCVLLSLQAVLFLISQIIHCIGLYYVHVKKTNQKKKTFKLPNLNKISITPQFNLNVI